MSDGPNWDDPAYRETQSDKVDYLRQILETKAQIEDRIPYLLLQISKVAGAICSFTCFNRIEILLEDLHTRLALPFPLSVQTSSFILDDTAFLTDKEGYPMFYLRFLMDGSIKLVELPVYDENSTRNRILNSPLY